MDKAVLEIGAGTGLLSVVASLLGKSVSSLNSLNVMWITSRLLPPLDVALLLSTFQAHTQGVASYSLTWILHSPASLYSPYTTIMTSV